MSVLTPSPATSAPAETQGRIADRCIMVIFGASGDLAARKLLPALYNLGRNNLLPKEFAILGFAKDDIQEEEYRHKVRANIHEYAGAPEGCSLCDWLADHSYYITGDFKNADDFAKLKDKIAALDSHHDTGGNVFYYLATLPQFFSEIVKQIGRPGTHGRR